MDDVFAGVEVVEDVAAAGIGVGRADIVHRAPGGCSFDLEAHQDVFHAFTLISDKVVIGIVKDQVADAHELKLAAAREPKVNGEIGICIVEIITGAEKTGLGGRGFGPVSEAESMGGDASGGRAGSGHCVLAGAIVDPIVGACGRQHGGAGERLAGGEISLWNM